MAELSNPRRERFCQELLVDDNQTQAYIRAGYPGRGANRSARRLIDRPEVAAVSGYGQRPGTAQVAAPKGSYPSRPDSSER